MPRAAPTIPRKRTAAPERPITDLTDSGLYIVMKIRTQNPKDDDFHWGLYLYRAAKISGNKYHVIGSPGSWRTDHEDTAGVFKSTFLVGLFQVAIVPRDREQEMDALIRQDDCRLNDIDGLNCVV